MIVAGFDTATPSTVVGVLLDDGRVAEARDDPQDGGRGAHASRLLVLAEQALAEAGAGWEDVGRLAVGVGPGGFTGLRIGIATARAIAQARDLPLVPVSSLAALAAGAMPAGGAAPPPGEMPAGGAAPPPGVMPAGGSASAAPPAPPPLVAAVIDARRGEVFAAVYRGPEPVMAPVALAPAALAERLLALDAPVQAVGDGAVRFRPELEGAGVAVPADGSSVHRIGAGPLCRLGLVAEPAERDALLPDYRREPDAKPPTR